MALAAGKRTAWIDKGPYYELVQVSSRQSALLISDKERPDASIAPLESSMCS